MTHRHPPKQIPRHKSIQHRIVVRKAQVNQRPETKRSRTASPSIVGLSVADVSKVRFSVLGDISFQDCIVALLIGNSAWWSPSWWAFFYNILSLSIDSNDRKSLIERLLISGRGAYLSIERSLRVMAATPVPRRSTTTLPACCRERRIDRGSVRRLPILIMIDIKCVREWGYYWLFPQTDFSRRWLFDSGSHRPLETRQSFPLFRINSRSISTAFLFRCNCQHRAFLMQTKHFNRTLKADTFYVNWLLEICVWNIQTQLSRLPLNSRQRFDSVMMPLARGLGYRANSRCAF